MSTSAFAEEIEEIEIAVSLRLMWMLNSSLEAGCISINKKENNMRKKIKGPITEKIDEKATQIANDPSEISLDVKRQQFKNYIDEFYRDFSGTSELLVERLKEIEFFTVSNKDILTSYLIGATTSLAVTFITNFAGLSFGINNIVSILLGLVVNTLVVIFSAFFLVKVLLHTIFLKKEPSTSYELLNLSEYEIETINDILEKRMEEAIKPDSNKELVQSEEK